MSLCYYKTEAVDIWRLEEFMNIVDSFEDELADRVKSMQVKAADDYLNIVLYATGKTIVTVREILTLSSQGYPDGALSLSRNLYEQFIILSFFEYHRNDNNFEQYIDDYCLNYELQRNRVLKDYYERTNQEDKLNEITEAQHNLKNRLHRNNKGNINNYSWSGESNFSQLEQRVFEMASKNGPDRIENFLMKLHFSYKRACVALHANTMGNSIRLGDKTDFIGIDTAPRAKGHGTPLWLSAVSLKFVIMNASELFNTDYSKYRDRLNKLIVFYNEKDQAEIYSDNEQGNFTT